MADRQYKLDLVPTPPLAGKAQQTEYKKRTLKRVFVNMGLFLTGFAFGMLTMRLISTGVF